MMIHFPVWRMIVPPPSQWYLITGPYGPWDNETFVSKTVKGSPWDLFFFRSPPCPPSFSCLLSPQSRFLLSILLLWRLLDIWCSVSALRGGWKVFGRWLRRLRRRKLSGSSLKFQWALGHLSGEQRSLAAVIRLRGLLSFDICLKVAQVVPRPESGLLGPGTIAREAEDKRTDKYVLWMCTVREIITNIWI